LTVDTSYWDPREANGIPVELISFGYNKIDSGIELLWQTATEINNRGFDIERKVGDSGFRQIGFVEGNGTTTEIHSYKFFDGSVFNQNVAYRLKQIDYNGDFEYSTVIEINFDLPLEYSLKQNYPNPFNPSTLIEFSIPEKTKIALKVFNTLGQVVVSLLESTLESGTYVTKFNGVKLPSGVYIYSILSDKYTFSRKMLLIK